MRKLIFLMVFFYATISGKSQSIGLHYYHTGSAPNVTATVTKRVNDHSFGIGLGYSINSIKQPDDQNNIYYRRLFATKAYHHLNLNFFYNRYLFTNLEHLKPYVFYDLQVKYSTTRTSMFIPDRFDSTIVADTPDEKLLYREYIEYFGPFWWIENTIGVGFEVDINEKWYINQKAGFGVHFIYGDKYPVLDKGKLEWEFCPIINFGIGFRLDKKMKE